jgi:hypothetical protein
MSRALATARFKPEDLDSNDVTNLVSNAIKLNVFFVADGDKNKLDRLSLASIF